MAILLQARGLGHSVGQRALFDDIDLAIAQGDRIGLVGHNGCGKSTLLGLLAGDQEPDAGEVTRRRGLRLGRVEQFLPAAVAELSAAQAVAERIDAGFDSRIGPSVVATVSRYSSMMKYPRIIISDASTTLR